MCGYNFLLNWKIRFICYYNWFGGHGGGAIPGLVSIPEVKSSCVLFVVLWMGIYGKLITLPAFYVYLLDLGI